jgi:succinoglycan biosynthesis protein ExoA
MAPKKMDPMMPPSVAPLPRVTAVVATCNEARFIERTLQSLLKQATPGFAFDIVVVDNGSTDGTAETVSRLARSEPRLRLLHLDRANTPAAFNAGIASAQGEYVCILGAHAEYPADYVATCLRELQAHGAVACSGRLITAPANGTAQSRVCAWAMAHPFCSSGSSVRTQQEGSVDTIPFPVMRKEAVLEVGGYDEALLRNQDNDMNQRLRARGYKLFLTAKVQCLYYARSSVTNLWKYGSRSGRWNAVTMRRNLYSLRLRHFVPLAFVLALLLVALVGLAGAISPSRSKIGVAALALFVLTVGAHLALGIAAGIQVAVREQSLAALWLPFVILGFHLTYGWGTLCGLLAAGELPPRAVALVPAPTTSSITPAPASTLPENRLAS